MIEELIEDVWQSDRLWSLREQLTVSYLSRMLLNKDASLTEEEAVKLSQAASILAMSKFSSQLDVALEIALMLASIGLEHEKFFQEMFRLVLVRSGNTPGASILEQQLGDRIALPLKLDSEISYRKAMLRMRVGEEALQLSRYQHNLWKALETGKDVATSAPTSAGKSFVVGRYLANLVANADQISAAYIVPSKALIRQVSRDLSEIFASRNIEIDVVTTLPTKTMERSKRIVFVHTQERFQIALKVWPDFFPTLLIADEIQGLAQTDRGVLLQTVIETSIERNPTCQVLVAGPNLNGLNGLDKALERRFHHITTDQAAVGQTLIFVDKVKGMPREGAISFIDRGEKKLVGIKQFDRPIRSKPDMLVTPALELGRGGQSIIYSSTTDTAEKISRFVAEEFERADADGELGDLYRLCKESVHDKFQLAEDVLHGVGYHYGPMPSILREAIEDAFKKGHLSYLVCTSTLLQGVNLPAKNIFLYDPRKGREKKDKISSTEFWNLAGRAGRLGREFSGNVFIIDYESWDSEVLEGDKKENLSISQIDSLNNDVDNIIDNLTHGGSTSYSKQDNLDTISTKLFISYLSGEHQRMLDRANVSEQQQDRYLSALEKLGTINQLPLEVLREAPGISVLRQNELFQAMRSYEDVVDLIPEHPSSIDAFDSLKAMYSMCFNWLIRVDNFEGIAAYTAVITSQWMRGHPVPRIIQEAYDYKISIGEAPKWGSFIRKVLRDIDRDVRFRAVKLTSCYNALLSHTLELRGKEKFLGSIPSIPAYLEMGASSDAMLALLNYGVSRFTAATVTDRAPIDGRMGREEIADLIRRRLPELDLTEASEAELMRIFKI